MSVTAVTTFLRTDPIKKFKVENNIYLKKTPSA